MNSMSSLRAQLEPVAELLADRRIAFLTGAGLSTDSGIPAYRGAGSSPRRAPMTVQTFLGSAQAQRRYWLGGHLGWRSFGAAEANAGHRAIAGLEKAGRSAGVITQNVDGLHLAAGSERVVELHGTMRTVLCLRCGQTFARDAVAAQIERRNPWLDVPDEVLLGPDGDVRPESTDGFVLPICTVCGGPLKPDVVFFGEFIPTERFATAEALLRSGDALIVAGSSLVVNSGIRIIERARRRGLPIVIVNLEPTRADAWASATIAASTSVVLPALQELLT
ncbi:NAD-dependent protein deacylase [Microbacterium azadirachtae]|uniref:protein acetyllysine N-acetyltransferase n=2 Tax=Microbacterium azadirachtae TaxID=582680 RepID=A0A0F0KEX1_9MICO|nr:NAD-dependent protein deacylase [Microbacterium azadirachtae]SDL24058.1 NAD-dependent protein deacetylase, SIR2 family [Microbacterium azadirachtae]SEF53948.1 NAD-dependent protein deacetylase, SIR2 family [Microbacterium azadirachtae]SEF54200.1 NAD-dependent protein deacetylase, SIR2 family [Microbacterium azadirachtae]